MSLSGQEDGADGRAVRTAGSERARRAKALMMQPAAAEVHRDWLQAAPPCKSEDFSAWQDSNYSTNSYG